MSNEAEGAATEPPTDDIEAVAWRGIALATIVAAAVRLSILASKWNQQLLLNDSLYYFAQASNNANGRWFKEFFGVDEGAEHPPLTSLVLTPLGLLDGPIPWMRLVMTLIGIAVVPAIGLLGHRFGGRTVGVVAALIAAVYPNLWMSDALLMSETIATMLIVLVLFAALRHQARFTGTTGAILGSLIGLGALTRAELLIFAPLLALTRVRSIPIRQWVRPAAAVLVTTFAVVLPWIAFNLARFDETVLMSTNEGSTFIGANCADSYSDNGLGGWSIVCLFESPGPPGEDTSQRSVRWRREAIEYVNDHRSRVPLVVAARVLRSIDLFGLRDLVRADVGEERYEWSVWAGVVCWWLLAPAALAGWWRNRHRYGLILGTPAVTVAVTAIVFYGAHRLRSPVEPVVVIAAAMFLGRFAFVRRLVDGIATTGPSEPPTESLARATSISGKS